MSIPQHTRAWADKARTAVTEMERVWIAYAPRPDSRTPGKPPSHSPARGRYAVATGGIVYARPSTYPATMGSASQAARATTTQIVRAAIAAVETAKTTHRSRSSRRERFRTRLPPDRARGPSI